MKVNNDKMQVNNIKVRVNNGKVRVNKDNTKLKADKNNSQVNNDISIIVKKNKVVYQVNLINLIYYFISYLTLVLLLILSR